MIVQVNTDRLIQKSQAKIEDVEETLRRRLDRYSDRLSRVELHLSDVNGPSDIGADKRCLIELRPKGLDPVVATDQAPTTEAAITGATFKAISALDKSIGRTTTRKGH